jgi:hypothetical protein
MENGEWRMMKNTPTRMDFNSQFSILNSTVRACHVFINCLVYSMGRPSIRTTNLLSRTQVVVSRGCGIRLRRISFQLVRISQ